jgi:hypothetical protein
VGDTFNIRLLHTDPQKESPAISALHDDAGLELVAENASRRAVLRSIGGLAVVAAGATARQTAWAAPESGIAKEIPMAQTGVDALTGRWKYRSFHNNPTFRVRDCEDLRDLVFAEADLAIDDFAPSEFRGRLVFESGSEMTLGGASLVGNPFTIRFQGRGVSPGN